MHDGLPAGSELGRPAGHQHRTTVKEQGLAGPLSLPDVLFVAMGIKLFVRLAALSTLFVAVNAAAQTMTSTVPPSQTIPDDPIAAVSTIWELFQQGMFLSGIIGILVLTLAVLNIGPLRDRFSANGPQDWVRPLLSLLIAGLGAAEIAYLTSGDTVAVILSGLGAGVGSGGLQRLVQEIRD